MRPVDEHNSPDFAAIAERHGLKLIRGTIPVPDLRVEYQTADREQARVDLGSRVAAVIPPCSLNGVTLTIRKFNARDFTINDLVEAGTLERWLANELEDYVLGRKNILISGGTGTGKTTLVNVLAKFIPEDERILLIEDTAEIQIEHPNLVRLEARQAQNGLPAVTIRDLLKAALRHRPDRIILGEIRGGEAYDL